MSGPFSIEEIENEIYQLVVSSKAREGHTFPARYVMLNMDKNGYTRDDFLAGIDSLLKKGLITEDEKIAENFFAELRSI
tara:strand:- start:4187 stop:4423 length:237 start_codon:yes stop_codon:yes gene_type:complete